MKRHRQRADSQRDDSSFMAIAGIALSLLGIACIFAMNMGALFAPLGLGLGLYSLYHEDRRGLALLAVVLGALGSLALVLFTVAALRVLFMLGSLWNEVDRDRNEEPSSVASGEFPVVPIRGPDEDPIAFTQRTLNAIRNALKHNARHPQLQLRSIDEALSLYRDGWNKRIRWSEDPDPTLSSAGPDQRFDTADDIRIPLNE